MKDREYSEKEQTIKDLYYIAKLWKAGGYCAGMQTDTELLRALRREIHRFPEPGWLTFRTTALAAELLEMQGFSVQVGEEIVRRDQVIDPPIEEQVRRQQELCREHLPQEWYDKWMPRMGNMGGLVAVYDSGIPGPVIAYRFDMDALEMTESDTLEHLPTREGFGSCCPGLFHACGHDGHTAMGVCLAKKFMEYKDQIKGKLIFIFQPAEEGVRGGKSYCSHWKYGRIDRLFCCHIGFTPAGTLVAGAGGFLATTKLDVEFTGRSAHAGLCPERGRNALLAASDAMVQMQNIVRPSAGITRLNVGQLQGGEARNTIPAHAVMMLETRGSDTVLNQYMRSQAETVIDRCAKKYDVTYTFCQKGESESADSSEALSREILRIAEASGEFEHCVLHQDFGASDDGAVFMNMVQAQGGQAAYLLLGTSLTGKHHETDFDFDEDVLRKGCNVLFLAGMDQMSLY